MIFPSGTAAGFATGALRASKRLHWTQKGARAEAEQWLLEMKIGPIKWEILDDQVVIGRNHNHIVVLRSVLLPIGTAPELTA